MRAPLVSVVVATWNSSHLLRYAVESVLRQDMPDFELLVVGDHCTDDTEEVVAGFGDPRIRFTNLPRNSGQQAMPNNAGVAMARGEYLAFLNHDDLYLPHHLGSCLAELRATRAGILLRAHATIPREQKEKLALGELVVGAAGHEPSGRFSPHTFHVASSWFMRREVAQAVGPWRLENESWVRPSQEWLFRAWRSGVRIRTSREISLVAIFSGGRRDVYRERDDAEHAFVFANVVSSDRLRARLVAEAQAALDAPPAQSPPRRPKPWPRRVEKRLRALRDRGLARLSIALGVHPHTWPNIRKWGWRRGGVIRAAKQVTG